ncbi:DUF3955 domain-containing protein [Bacillus cereus]|uniref:DUF3955 domain-containing protein n=1 Tax=Bacillus cereus TaxID=1396 RepID=UPI0024BD3A85|nr:DUF3955 domain-containing protein [Bacillus cereus]
MKNKYVLASVPIFLGIICIAIYNIIGVTIGPNGELNEPFYLIPFAFLFFFSGIVALSLVTIFSISKKDTTNNWMKINMYWLLHRYF